jgi:hypothetical protein
MSTICSIINTTFALANEAEILAIARSQGVGNPYLRELNGCMFCKGADLAQMNVLPSIVVPAPRNTNETPADYETRTAAFNTAELLKVKIDPSPFKVMIINSVEDFHILSRQDPTLIPVEI